MTVSQCSYDIISLVPGLAKRVQAERGDQPHGVRELDFDLVRMLVVIDLVVGIDRVPPQRRVGGKRHRHV